MGMVLARLQHHLRESLRIVRTIPTLPSP